MEKHRCDLQKISFYAKELAKDLPPHVFRPVPTRLLWVVLNYAVISLSVFCILQIDTWYVDSLAALLMGHSMGALFFVGHEMGHGSIVKNRTLIMWLTTLCLMPFGLHAKTWMVWHNRGHHAHTNHPYKDPDCFGKKYTYDKLVLGLQNSLPGSGTLLSYTFLFWFFSFFTFYSVWLMPKVMGRRDELQTRLFWIMVYASWISLATLSGPLGIVYLFLLPVMACNCVVMSYIVTNHFLSPLTEDVNDPLVNSLSVKTWKLFDILHTNASYHTEHHIFPNMSPKYAPLVAELLKAKFPDKYQHIAHGKALRLAYSLPKFYEDDLTLVNIKTHCFYPTPTLNLNKELQTPRRDELNEMELTAVYSSSDNPG